MEHKERRGLKVRVLDKNSKYYNQKLYIYKENEYWVWLSLVAKGGAHIVIAKDKISVAPFTEQELNDLINGLQN